MTLQQLTKLLHGFGDLYSAQVWITYTFHTFLALLRAWLSDHGASTVLKIAACTFPLLTSYGFGMT